MPAFGGCLGMISKLQNPWRNFVRRTSRVMRSVLHSGDIPVIVTWQRTRDPDRGSLVLWPGEGHRAVRARSGIARGTQWPCADRSARSLLDEWLQNPGFQPSPAQCGLGLGDGLGLGKQNPLHLSHPTPPITTSPSGPPCRARLYLVETY